jgi:hypothetical protein
LGTSAAVAASLCLAKACWFSVTVGALDRVRIADDWSVDHIDTTDEEQCRHEGFAKLRTVVAHATPTGAVPTMGTQRHDNNNRLGGLPNEEFSEVHDQIHCSVRYLSGVGERDRIGANPDPVL